MSAPTTTGGLSYALITAARNEAAFIERTLQSVVQQTARPLRWMIVSDGSTDGTDDIVRRYARQHAWIELLRVESPDGRDFARKARAFNGAYARLRDLRWDVVGNVDADLSFDEECFAFLLERFAEMPELGVAGAACVQPGERYDYRFGDASHVSGPCQFFRRGCIEAVGPYVPVAGGGIDWIAVTTARMQGWKTRTFLGKTCVHHRTSGSEGRGALEVWVRRGMKDYALGGHPLWQLARSIYQSKQRPYVVGGLMLLGGYAYGVLTGAPRPVSDSLVRFHRAEQMARLKRVAYGLLPLAPRAAAPATDLPLAESIARLEGWVEGHDYKGYEPFDGLSSYVRPLTFGNRRLEQIVVQVGRWSPLNLRPLLGIKPLESTKGRGYMAMGYITLARSGRQRYARKAVVCLEWLMRNASPRYRQYSWGNHFDWASRAGRYAKQESIIVWTALIGEAFLDAYETLGEPRYLEVARSVCDWICNLPRERTAHGACLSYLATRQLSVHNANLLGAAMLARTAKHVGSAELVDVARAAVEYSCTRQLANGAWYYAEDPHYRWIDNFHTGYNLDSLKSYIESTGDRTFAHHLDHGFAYFKSHFFESDGRPKYYADRTYPIDIQCAAQSIETLTKFSDRDPAALSLASTVARWTIRNLQDPRGYFYYRRYRWLAARIPMLHWGQATMYRALALLSVAVAEHSAGALHTPAAEQPATRRTA